MPNLQVLLPSPQAGEQVTRARCAECGAVLAIRYDVSDRDGKIHGFLVQPCGACLQEAREDAIASYNDSREPPVDEGRD